MRQRTFVILFALLMEPRGGVGAAETPKTRAPESIDVALEEIRAKHRQPGIAAAVAREDGIIALGATGVRREGSKDRVGVKDRFHVGSCTKAMTATVIAILVEEGKLAWDTPIVKVLPELEKSIDPGYRTVTLEQLLQHRAGVPSFTQPSPDDQALLASITGSPLEQRRRFAAKLLERKPEVEPGTTMVYSNAGY